MPDVAHEEAPISLYLQLEQGTHADLEVVAKASIAFSKAVEELAYILDPTMTVRVEIVSGSEGSLGIDNLIKVIRSINDGASKSKGLKWLAIIVAIRIVNNAFDWTQDQVMDWLTGSDPAPVVRTMSKEELSALAEEVVRINRSKAAEPQIRAIYREMERDTKIEGVGVAFIPKQRPKKIVPRNEFANRAGTSTQELTEGRVTTSKLSAVLISPVLVAGNRRWRFRADGIEFGAVVKDMDFLEAVLTGRSGAHMKAGIEIEMDLETTEELQDGVWVITQRRVARVYGWNEPPTQGDLGLTPA